MGECSNCKQHILPGLFLPMELSSEPILNRGEGGGAGGGEGGGVGGGGGGIRVDYQATFSNIHCSETKGYG